MKTRSINPFGLRLQPDLKEMARVEAEKNHRSINTELTLLIEDGFKWREMQQKRAIA